MCVTTVSEVEKERGWKSTQKIMAENFPNLIKGITSNTINPKKSSPRHITVWILKIKYKEKNVHISERETTPYLQVRKIWMTVDFSSETMEARGSGTIFFQCWKEKNGQPGILHPAKISFRDKGEIKTFSDEEKLRELVASRPIIKERMQEVEMKW